MGKGTQDGGEKGHTHTHTHTHICSHSISDIRIICKEKHSSIECIYPGIATIYLSTVALWEFPLWRIGVSGILGALGSRVNPWSAQWVRDPVPTQPQLRLLLWLRYDPWPGNSICQGAAKKEKEKKKRTSILNKTSTATLMFFPAWCLLGAWG